MSDSIMKIGPQIANVGKVFQIGEAWRCQCGAEHKFGAYAAAHWDEELNHTCSKCEASRTFLSGEVVA